MNHWCQNHLEYKSLAEKRFNMNEKLKGYNVFNGKKELNVGSLEILKGGRGNAIKKHG